MQEGDEKSSFSTIKLKKERDLQGEGGGGGYDNYAYINGSDAANNDKPNRNNNNFETVAIDVKGSQNFTVINGNEKPSSTAIMPAIRDRLKKTCTKKTLYKRLPILNWLPKYNREDAVGDLLAGITVGLTVIPQSLAYSNIAGLPPQYGLYGSFLGCFVYILFGTCKDVPVGPTAIASLLTYQALNGKGPEHAILLCFLTGLIELMMGVFGLGFLLDFVSGPVSSGFTSAVALIIVTSQVKDVLRIQTSGTTFVEQWISIFRNIHQTEPWDTVLGVICIVTLLLMRLITSIKIGKSSDKKPSLFVKSLNNFFWLFGTSRNAILVVVTGCIGYYFHSISDTRTPFKLIGAIPAGMPTVAPPPFQYYNATNNATETFVQMVSSYGSSIIVVPLIALLEDVAICKAFANGKTVDATQEMIAIGLSNVANSFVQSFPGSGSLSRSAVNNASGVRTPFGNFYTGLLVIIALIFFTPYFFYIPKAALAAIIIAAVVFMVEVKVVKPMWRTKKSDLIPGLGTFIACLVLPLEIGIVVGVCVNLLFILYHAARPKITVETLRTDAGVDYLMLTPDRCLIFPSMDYVRNLVTKHSTRTNVPVVIDCSHIYGADYTAATVIETLTNDFHLRKQPLYFYNLKPSVGSVFSGLSPKDFCVIYNRDDLNESLNSRMNCRNDNSVASG